MSSLDEHTAIRYSLHMVRLVTLLFVLSCIAAQARIDENLAECEARYGPVVEHRQATVKESDKETAVFSKNGVTVIAEFHSSKVWKITYNKIGMEPGELDTLLSANATGGTWSQPLKISGQDVRTSTDHERIAIFTPGKRPEATFTLVIATRAFTAANRSEYETKLSAIPAILKHRGDGKALKDF